MLYLPSPHLIQLPAKAFKHSQVVANLIGISSQSPWMEISKTTKLIGELREAGESLNRSTTILMAEGSRLYNEVNQNKHRQLTIWIRSLSQEIYILERFPNEDNCTLMYCNTTGRSIQFPTAKEVAEPIQRTKIQFQHNTKNLAAERKMVRDLLEQETERRRQHQQQQLQLQIQAEFAARIQNYRKAKAYYRPKLLPNKPLKRLIVMWADKIEHVSSLIFRDSRNLEVTSESWEHVKDLEKTGVWFRSQQSNIDKAEFAEHWNSLKQIRNSISKIKYDLMREGRRHSEGYAASERVEEKRRELWRRISEMNSESCKLQREERVANKHLTKLHKLQSEAASSSP